MPIRVMGHTFGIMNVYTNYIFLKRKKNKKETEDNIGSDRWADVGFIIRDVAW